MARLPIPGSDVGDWGNILNGFLEIAHNSDGTLQTPALKQAGGVMSVNNQTPSNGNVTVTAVNGVTVTGTPTDGQVLTATGATAASWSTQSSTPVQGVSITRSFSFAYNTPNLATGIVAYTPTPGDVLLSISVSIVEAWDGTSPTGAVGLILAGYVSEDNLLVSDIDMTQNNSTNQGVEAAAYSYELEQLSLFTTSNPLCMAVNTGSFVATYATGDANPEALPLVIQTGVNDEFVYTPSSTNIPETFTMAAGTYSSQDEVVAAVSVATGSVSEEPLSTYVTVSGGGSGDNFAILFQAVVIGSAANGDSFSAAGSNDGYVTLGLTNESNLSGGQDATGNPDSSQGSAVLYITTATPATI